MAKVLCIEDEPDLREQIVEELDDAGYDVVEAEDGPKGLAAILEHRPDLVLSDVNMPGFSGHEVMKRIRAEHPELADMPFIFLTALAERNQMIEAKKLGADDYLTKPVDFELLLASLEARLGQVERMAGFKQTQMVKLYQAMAKKPVDAHDDDLPISDTEITWNESVDGTPVDKHAVPAKSMRVLVAAHEHVDLQALKAAFESQGHECFATESGRAVMREFAEKGADVLLIAQNTIDLSATMIAKTLSTSHSSLPPIMFMVDPDRRLTFDLQTQKLFAGTVPLLSTPHRIVEATLGLLK